ncbi:hypothetical protein ES288_D05G303900v1 [Gossypium darwinii]|uniref:Uncharacterized protein n=2 Tax=Gossypium TaxID=3633 RepID=A0A5D2L1V8_GOSTO|nr:hypothetical protein ES288_D05G303900v1 [Gossypium darwinii]TYH73095.1 hypothetical protein ES332_D05G304000v1 [Gossypium tomentosum]
MDFPKQQSITEKLLYLSKNKMKQQIQFFSVSNHISNIIQLVNPVEDYTHEHATIQGKGRQRYEKFKIHTSNQTLRPREKMKQWIIRISSELILPDCKSSL